MQRVTFLKLEFLGDRRMAFADSGTGVAGQFMKFSTALVLLMTPALAFFYGGLVRSKNALNTMMMSFISLGFVGVLWALVGYSLALTPGSNWLGDMSLAFLNGVGPRVGESGLGLINGHAYSAPYEDVTLVAN
mgnify:CR=1 FL=1